MDNNAKHAKCNEPQNLLTRGQNNTIFQPSPAQPAVQHPGTVSPAIQMSGGYGYEAVTRTAIVNISDLPNHKLFRGISRND